MAGCQIRLAVSDIEPSKAKNDSPNSAIRLKYDECVCQVVILLLCNVVMCQTSIVCRVTCVA